MMTAGIRGSGRSPARIANQPAVTHQLTELTGVGSSGGRRRTMSGARYGVEEVLQVALPQVIRLVAPARRT